MDLGQDATNPRALLGTVGLVEGPQWPQLHGRLRPLGASHRDSGLHVGLRLPRAGEHHCVVGEHLCVSCPAWEESGRDLQPAGEPYGTIADQHSWRGTPCIPVQSLKRKWLKINETQNDGLFSCGRYIVPARDNKCARDFQHYPMTREDQNNLAWIPD